MSTGGINKISKRIFESGSDLADLLILIQIPRIIKRKAETGAMVILFGIMVTKIRDPMIHPLIPIMPMRIVHPPHHTGLMSEE
jgi:hypothetical protein